MRIGRSVSWKGFPMNANKTRKLALLLATTTMLMALEGVALVAAPAYAQSASDTVHTFDVPAKPIRQALHDIARVAGISVMFDETAAASAGGKAVRGSMTTSEAISRALSGSGLSWRFTNGSTVTIIDPAPGVISGGAGDGTVLETITVDGRSATTEGRNSYTTADATIGKGAASVRETPQAVTVVTARQIEDRNFTSMTEALDQAAGVTVQGNAISARGFPMTLRTDSGAQVPFNADDFVDDPLLIQYDRIEVLRGPDGLYSGAGEPGGAINLVRKRPRDDRQVKASASAGSHGTYRTTIDATGPLNSEGTLRGRILGTLERNAMSDGINDPKNAAIVGMLEADLGESTTVMMGGRYSRESGGYWDWGFPTYANGELIDFPVDSNLAADWSRRTSEAWEIFGDVSHEFDNGWIWTTRGSYTRQNWSWKMGYLTGAVDPVTGDGMSWAGQDYTSDGYTGQIDTNLQGTFDAFGRTHEFIVGFDYTKHDSESLRWNYQGPAVNLSDFASARWAEPTTPDWGYRYPFFGDTQYGLYARGKFEITDDLYVIAGARYSNYRFLQRTAGLSANGTQNWTELTDYRDTGVFVPFGALTYDFADDWTAYASIAEIYKPQANFLTGPEPGTPLDPITGTNYEVGVKGTLLDGRINTSVALYYTKRKSEAIADPAYPWSYNGANGSQCCYLPSGEVVSRGIDLEMSGEVTTGLNLIAGYTYNHNRNRATDTVYSAVTPSHLLKLWATYTLPGELEDWTIGAGLRAQSKTYVIANNVRIEQDAYAVADASVQYKINENFNATLNVNNLFDQKYLRKIGTTTDNGSFYGASRNFLLTLRASF